MFHGYYLSLAFQLYVYVYLAVLVRSNILELRLQNDTSINNLLDLSS